jgi:ABC-2 type transport system ATP-binding protein
LIELQGVTKRFGEKVAVDNLTLSVPKGELFAFLGPNGAGKTTTIKMLAGLLKPTAGKIAIAGHNLDGESLAAKKIMSYVPDQPYLYERLSGREFLNLVGDLYGMPREKADEEIARLCQLFEMEEYLDEFAENYSHGMKQRVVLSAALLHQPQVIVIDEPMVGLDPKSARLVKDILKKRVGGGVTVFMSTHTLAVAEELADRIGIINRGRLVALGTLNELKSLGGTQAQALEEVFLTLTEEKSLPPGTHTGQ